MSIFDTLEKRHHVLKYKPEIISDELLKTLLYKAWKITPSKQNCMPYNVSILGPDKQEEKNIIYNKVVGNHQVWENTGLTKDTNANPKIQGEYKFNLNPNYTHVISNSHLLMFSQRVCKEPNRFYKRAVLKEGHYLEQCELDDVESTAESVSFEVGLFTSNLTSLCIENKVDVSYCGCFPKSKYMWKDTPYLWYDTERKIAHVHAIMSIGYGDYYRHEWLKKINKTSADIKPEIDEVVQWI
jgi:hypothetical protein